MQITGRDARGMQPKIKTTRHIRRLISRVVLVLSKMLNSARSRKRIVLVAICLLVPLGALLSVFDLTTPAQAASSTLNFQGRLLSSTGSLVPDGNYHIEFKLYNDTTSAGTPDQGACTYGGGTPDTECLWVETRSTGNLVTVQNGYFSVYLGDVTSLPTIDWSQDLYLGMNIGGSSGSPSWDGEMTPRFKLTSVPYAYTSQNVATKETNSASTNSDSVSITSGNALGATSNSGNISIDTGTATGTTGSILLGPSSTSSILFGNGTSNPDFTFQGSGTFTIASLDCTGNANGGALTANGSGVISCSDDDGGGGSGLFTDGGTFTYLTSTTDDLVVGASSVAGASLFVDVSAGSVTIGNGSLAGSLIISDGSSNTGTILVNATAGDYSFTIPTVTANDTFCLSALGNCAGVGGVGDIVNNGQNGTVRVGSNDSNSVILETSNTDRLTIDSAGAATFTSTVTGTTLNATTGVNTGAGAGTQRIDASGNLVNIGTITSGLINGQTISSSANFTGTITVQGASATLGVASTTTGSAIFRNAGGSGGITLTPANPGASSYTITLPAETGTVCTTATVCTGYAPSSGGSYIAKNTNDTSTASYAGYLLGLTNTNTGAAGVLSLSNAGTSGALSITSSTTGNGQSISLTNTSGSQTAGLAIDRNGAGGTTSSLIRLSQTAGTASNALTIAGTFTNIINATNFTVNNAGAITTSVGSGGSSLYNSSSGSGLVLSALNGTTTAQLRVTSNNNGWADSQTTSYFQVKNTSNNNLTFMGGGYGTDTQLNRLQFASLYTTITDLAFTSTPAPTALFELVSGNTTKVNLKVKAAASQTSDLLQLQDSSSNVNASFSSSGAQLTLGRIASTGSVVQGQLILSDGTTDNFSSTLQTATLGASRTITLPDETGTVCTTGSVCSGYQASSTAIVQVPTTTAQNTIQPTAASVVALTVNGSSNATGAVALSVAQTKAFAGISVTQSAAAVGLSITSSSTGNGQNISLTNTSGTQVAGVSIDRNGAGGTTTSLLSLSQTSGTATNGILLSGTIGTDITTSANRALTIDSNGTGTLTVGGGTGIKTINLATGGTGAKTVTLGSTASTGTTTIQAGSGGIALNNATISTNATTVDLLNTTATTVNAFQAGTSITIGATTGTTNIRNALSLGTTAVAGSLLISDGSSSTITLKPATQVAATNYDITIPAITASDTVCLLAFANCSGSGVTTVGAIDTPTTSANGAHISGSTIYLQTATGSVPGLLSTTTQSLAGNKTLTGNFLLSGNTAYFSNSQGVYQSEAFGSGASVYQSGGGTNNVAVGYGAIANAGSGVAIGSNANASTTSSGGIAIGDSASSTGGDSVIIGHTASGTSEGAIAIGYATSVGYLGIGIGYNVSAGSEALNIGNSIYGDLSNDRIAVGTSTTSAGRLTVDNSSSTDAIFVANDNGSAVFTIADGGTVTSKTILPLADDTYDLGSTGSRWANLYLGGETIHLGTSTTDEATFGYNTTTNILNIGTDSTTNGDIAFFIDDLYLDKSVGYVGIGTTAPGATLELKIPSDLRPAGTPATLNLFRMQGGQGGSIWGQRWDTNVVGVDVNNSKLVFAAGNNSSGSYVTSDILSLYTTGNATLAGDLTVSGTGTSQFSGIVDATKGFSQDYIFKITMSTATQTITTGTTTAINYDNTTYDFSSGVNLSTDRYTVPTNGAGIWHLDTEVQWSSASATGYRVVYIARYNSSNVLQELCGYKRDDGSTIGLVQTTGCDTYASAGDYFKTEVLHNRGSNLDITSGSGVGPIFSGHLVARQ